MTEGFTIQLPKITEKKLLARYDNMLQKAIEKALEDKELYKPMGLVPLARCLNDNYCQMAEGRHAPYGD
ncbi:hypothetical protein J2T50_001785 [Streptococcus gallinaceus]|nr:hypothetical protein [Streptococcus gallinaceus]MCP1770844.1 hypothetical protein [Streptococcus gallinaceus]